MAVDDVMLLRVSAESETKEIGNAIHRHWIETGELPSLRAVGVRAVNQAVKGIAVAGGLIGVRGRMLATTIGFDDIVGSNGDTISAMSFHLFLR